MSSTLTWLTDCLKNVNSVDMPCAREAGVDPAAVYRHFKSKDDLLAHLASRAFNELAVAMEPVDTRLSTSNPKETLVEIGMAYINYATAEPHIFQMMFDIAGRCKRDGLSGFTIQGKGAHGILVEAVERLAPASPQHVHVFTLWSVVHGFAKLANSGLGPEKQELDPMSRALCQNVVELINAHHRACFIGGLLDTFDSCGINRGFRPAIRDQFHPCHQPLPSAYIADDVVLCGQCLQALIQLCSPRIKAHSFRKAGSDRSCANRMRRVGVAVVNTALRRIAVFKHIRDFFIEQRSTHREIARGEIQTKSRCARSQ